MAGFNCVYNSSYARESPASHGDRAARPPHPEYVTPTGTLPSVPHAHNNNSEERGDSVCMNENAAGHNSAGKDASSV